MMRGPEVPVDRPEDPVVGEERPPVFGTWRRMYAAVVLNAILVMALVFVFSRWRY
jgi:hypothetical protein